MQTINAGHQCAFLLDLKLEGFCSNALVCCNPTSSKALQPAFSLAASFSSIIFCFASFLSLVLRQLWRVISGLPGFTFLLYLGSLGVGIGFPFNRPNFHAFVMTSSVTFGRHSWKPLAYAWCSDMHFAFNSPMSISPLRYAFLIFSNSSLSSMKNVKN